MRAPVQSLMGHGIRSLLYHPGGLNVLPRGEEESPCHLVIHFQPTPPELSAFGLDAADTSRAAIESQGTDSLE
jgi:hypothetical protein